MSKRAKTRRGTRAGPKPAGSARWRWRRIGWRVVVAAVFVAGSTAGLAAYKHRYDVTHDLSALGNGVPTVVQIHDPSCPKCQRLKRNASAAARGFGDALQFRIADVNTAAGRRLQRTHDVPHVTLLLFDGSGEMSRVIGGVNGVDSLRRAFAALVERSGRARGGS